MMVAMRPSQLLRETRVIVRLPDTDADSLMLPCEVLVQEGFAVWALAPDRYDQIAPLLELFEGRAEVGVLGLRTREQVTQVAQAGAGFVLLAEADADVVAACAEAGLAVFPPATTATEVRAVAGEPATGVQVVPVDAFGSSYARYVLDAVRDVPLIAVAAGEISHDAFEQWLREGALAVVLDDSLLGNSHYVGGDLEGLRDRCRGYSYLMPTPQLWDGVPD